ncbi:MAG: TPM domain-containing protein [Ruminococcus sp.]|nr:TPM domain-containing protein [Ruminococcus sp.]
MHNAIYRCSRIYAIFAVFLFALFSPFLSVNAAANAAQKVYDRAGLLTDSEVTRLEEQLDQNSANCGANIIVYTVTDLGGRTTYSLSEALADSIDTNPDSKGVFLLLSINDREYEIYSYGPDNEQPLTAGNRDYITDSIQPYLADGDYYRAFSEFGRLAEKYVSEGDGSSGVMQIALDMTFLTFLPGCAVVSLIIVLVMKAGMKTARPEITAGNYVKGGSFHVTSSRDVYLYTSTTRRKIESSSSGSHHSSGGHHSSGHRSGGSHRSGGHSHGRF